MSHTEGFTCEMEFVVGRRSTKAGIHVLEISWTEEREGTFKKGRSA